MDTLSVRAYNVRFGDAIFVEVPDKDPKTKKTMLRHILIDMGNCLNKAGGVDTVFKPAFDDIVKQLGGQPLDLYVMTHEHMDHVQGLQYVAEKVYPDPEFAKRLKVDYAWLTASAAEDYYQRFPNAQKQKKAFELMYDEVARFLAASPEDLTPPLAALLANNAYQVTGKCVDFLRKLAAAQKTSYVYRACPLAQAHPFKEARFEIWGPEQDTTDYYGKFQPKGLKLAAASASEGAAAADAPDVARPLPPAGVDAGAFYDLVDMRSNGFLGNMLAIDQAANNTSVVFSLEWRGWRLLFPGDAEIRSWKTMQREGALKPVHFLKVAHHSSHNGTPDDALFDAILPEKPPDKRQRRALISTWLDTYGGIPHAPTIKRLKSRCDEVLSIHEHGADPYLEFRFQG